MQIYLDNAATTRPVLDAEFQKHLEESWYNPSAAYAPAARVFIDMKKARTMLASTLGLNSDVIFTSGGTEANNTAILSAYKIGAHFITSAIEHPSVYETFKYLETLGAKVDYVKPKGLCVLPEDVAERIKDNTVMVSIMHVNNETGALNDINAIAHAVKAKNSKTLFHSDGVQALFKTRFKLSSRDVDYYTVSAHKINALKGVGALLINKDKTLQKLHHGGEQEYALRPGTENTLGIQVFHQALKRGINSFDTSIKIVEDLHKKLIDGVNGIEGAKLNLPDKKVPHIVNVSFSGVRAEVLVRALGEKGIFIGTGAACSRGKISRVLLESGMIKELAEGAVRISFSALNTRKEIDICLEEIDKAVKQLRRFSRR